MEAKPTSTNAAKVQPTTTNRNVVFDYLQQKNTETRPRGGGSGRPQGDLQNQEQRPRRGGRGGYDRQQNNENENNIQSSDDTYNTRPRTYQNR